MNSKHEVLTRDYECEVCEFLYFLWVYVSVLTRLQTCTLIGRSYLDESSGSVHIVTVSMAVSPLI